MKILTGVERLPYNHEKWVWMPHAAHLCVSQDCQFVLATYVGNHIVSTVGEWLPRSLKLSDYNGKSVVDVFEEIGFNRKYETMVFVAQLMNDSCSCCPYVINGSELDMAPYNTADEAYIGHILLCHKWTNAKVEMP